MRSGQDKRGWRDLFRVAQGGTSNTVHGILGVMRYRVVLVQSDEGYAVSCPALRGCHSQGATREEALESIRDAIREWLAAEDDERAGLKVTEAEVVV
jgi:predicted RNase H-like HicB family nuclease